jgi:hypothetical protein
MWGKKPLKQRAANFCWIRSSFLASVDATEFQTTETYSSVDLIDIKYNMFINTRDK